MATVDGPLVSFLEEPVPHRPSGSSGLFPDVTLLHDGPALHPPNPPPPVSSFTPRASQENTPLLSSAPVSSSTPRLGQEYTPLLGRCGDLDTSLDFNNFPDDLDYTALLSEAEAAIEHGIYPERISQGSSGSYFVKNLEGVRIVLNYRSICYFFVITS